jgi:hypothetical protein
MKIRKPINELTLHDISKFPIWEYALDEESVEGQDETTVRPYRISKALDPSQGMFVVRASFTLSDGSKMLGYLTPPLPDDNGLARLQPVIITEKGHVRFWHGALKPSTKELTQSYEMLGRSRATVFPIQAVSDVKLVGSAVHITIMGFMTLKNLKTNQVAIVK